MNAVVRNTFIQGILSIVFVTLAIVVIITAVLAVLRSRRTTEVIDAEDPALPSRTYAPAGLFATRSAKALERRWAAEQPATLPGGGH